ncbi:MAG: hypothetical protein QME59_03960, partial [Candidatus Hydrothermarchaeota archaeon]|nr:hypothetical protein [Candidatus Hydrothermarchaeota archaeon]
RRIHKICYSFVLWDYGLRRIPNSGKVFLKEMKSDAIQSIPLMLMGFKKPVSVLFRGMIENSLKHIYFIDHPVEFEWLATKPKYYITIDDLCNYIKDHSSFKSVVRIVDIVDITTRKYDKFSRLIHGRGISNMQLVKSLSNIRRDEEFIAEYSSDLSEMGNVINLMFGIFHKKKFNRFNNHFRKLILSCMDSKNRRIFHEVEAK